MLFELTKQDFLMLLVYIRHFFDSFLGLHIHCHVFYKNTGCISEPDGAVIVFSKFASHFQNFFVPNFLDVVTHLVALFEAIFEIVTCSDHSYFFAQCSKVVLDFRLTWQWQRSIKIYCDRFACALFTIYNSLEHSNHFPTISIRLSTVCIKFICLPDI